MRLGADGCIDGSTGMAMIPLLLAKAMRHSVPAYPCFPVPRLCAVRFMSLHRAGALRKPANADNSHNYEQRYRGIEVSSPRFED